MAKITKNQIEKAMEQLKSANGNRRTRTITESELQNLITDAEKTYKENSKEKYFIGITAKEKGDWDSKPKSYKYSAYTTEVKIELRKNQPAKINIYENHWDYIPVSEKRMEIVYC